MKDGGTKLYRGSVLTPLREDSYKFLADGGILVDPSGTILEVGEYRDVKVRQAAATEVDFSSHLIVPGFIDTHVHLPQYGVVSLYGKELLAWLTTQIFPAEGNFTAEKANTLSPTFFRSLLAHGITTAAVYCSVQKDSTSVAFEWAEKIGIRAIIGKVMMDQNSPDSLQEKTAASLRASEELCRKWHGAADGRLLYAFTPRFAPTCSRALMKATGELANQYGAYVQTHLAENQEEVKWVRDLFPETQSYADVYFASGLLGPKTVMAHAIYLNSEEQHLLKDTGTCVSHCPTSNLFLRSGLMPLREMMDLGLAIGLGSDVAGGPTLSPFEVMRTAVYIHSARRFLPGSLGGEVSLANVFYLATLGGAKTLGLEKRIGSLEPGKDADFIVLNPKGLDLVQQEGDYDVTPEALLSSLVFRGDDRIVEQTYVRGALCHRRAS